MKVRFLAAIAAGALLSPVLASAQSMPSGMDGAQPWVADRSVGEGVGIKAGDFELHPGVSGEVGFDSNYFQRSGSADEQPEFGDPAESMRFRITPQLSLRTLDRRIDESGDAGKDDRPIAFAAMGSVSYNEFIATDGANSQDFRDSRNLQGGGGLNLSILPGRRWSGDVGASYAYIFDPSNQGGLTSDFSRHLVDVNGQLKWAPGGGAFEWTLLQYGTRLSFFDQDVSTSFDNNNHKFTTLGRWKFLPKTAVLYDGSVGIVRYNGTGATLNDGEYLQARMGLSGLVTKRIGLMAMGGWASSFYGNENGVGRNYNDLLANAEVRWYITSGNERRREGWSNIGASTLTTGYSRTFQDGYLGDWYQSDRGYMKFSYLIGGMVLTSAEVGVAQINYPDFLLEGAQQAGFDETRLNVKLFGEYRPLRTLGVNLQLEYNQNFSETLFATTYTDDLSFNRFRAFAGVRWFM